HDHGHVGRLFLGRSQHLESVYLRHSEVGDDRVERIPPDRLDRGRPAVGECDLVAGLLQRDGQQVTHALLVVHHQDPCFFHVFLVSDRRLTPTRLRTSMVPPCSSSTRYTSASPMPLPSGLVEKKGSKM